jgi:putative transposase
VGRYQARGLRRKAGIAVKQRKPFRVTTDSRPRHPVALNRLDRQFEVARPNQVWASDITYLWTAEGWVYLAIVIDWFSRQVVGWSMNSRLTADLTREALTRASVRRRPAPGLLHHSDRGVSMPAMPIRRSWHTMGCYAV